MNVKLFELLKKDFFDGIEIWYGIIVIREVQ